jgi:hypothetical protein
VSGLGEWSGGHPLGVAEVIADVDRAADLRKLDVGPAVPDLYAIPHALNADRQRVSGVHVAHVVLMRCSRAGVDERAVAA